jgi:hypothetical protein
MQEKTWMRSSSFRSDSRKPKTCPELCRRIQNRKLVGIVALAVAFAMCGAVAQAQQPKKVTRIGYLSSVDSASESARAEGIRLALREFGYIEGQNTPSSTGIRRGRPIGPPSLRPSWCVSRSISS